MQIGGNGGSGKAHVATGALEPIEFLALSAAGAGVGSVADLALTVRRQSDGMLYDWSDDTFKASGWTAVTTTLTEIDGTNVLGAYHLTKAGHVGGWNSATPTNNAANDSLFFYVSGGTGVDNTPTQGELKIGVWVDTIATINSDTNDIQGRLPTALVDGRIDASVGAVAADAITAAAIANGAIDAATFAAGAIDAAAIATDAITAGKIAADAIASSELAATAATEIAAAVAAGSAAAIADAVWDEKIKDHKVAGSFGKKALWGP